MYTETNKNTIICDLRSDLRSEDYNKVVHGSAWFSYSGHIKGMTGSDKAGEPGKPLCAKQHFDSYHNKVRDAELVFDGPKDPTEDSTSTVVSAWR